MSDSSAAIKTEKRRTPADVSEFEREQLRFFLSREDVAATLAQLNPSLAWLPALAEMNLIKKGSQLAPWIERNFADPQAVEDVVANIRFFDADAAEILEYRLNLQEAQLPAYLTKSWRLVIRHMREARRGLLRNEWFELLPRIGKGETSHEVLERLANVLRPKLAVGKRMSWRSDDTTPPERPSDLMSIEYEIEEGVSEQEVLNAWPANAVTETEERLLQLLSRSLSVALEDATDAGVEGNQGYSTSDGDVPSVAKHGQNAYRSGFLAIVRVSAEIWTRLAKKDAGAALPFVTAWSGSPYRLVRRLALFAAADPVVSASQAADVLIALPLGEVFLTNSSVEVYRLIRARWSEFSAEKRAQLEQKIIAGPPTDWFRDGVNIEPHIDRSRFDLLGDMKRSNLELSDAAKKVFDEVEVKYPEWRLRNAEQAGFHAWMGSGGRIVANPDKLVNVADEDLIDAAKKIIDKKDFMDGDAWREFSQANPMRALNALEADAKKKQWRDWAWNPFLWISKGVDDPADIARVAALLLKYPNVEFGKIAPAASWWLNEKFEALDDGVLWSLWDRIEEASRAEPDPQEANDA